MIQASAPGKLMLCGEYSVVHPGSTALAAAVGARLTVALTLGGRGWKVTSPALGVLDASADRIPIVQAALDDTCDLPSGGHLKITSDLGVGPNKPGLGSSAALAVAALSVLRAATGGTQPTLAEAVAVHRTGQAGMGSGYDVAVALEGGLCLYDTTSDFPRVESLSWPAGLHGAILYTGRGASTTKMLSRLADWRKTCPIEVEEHTGRMALSASRLCDAWRAGDVCAILDAVAMCQEHLTLMEADGVLGILEGDQSELLAAVEDAGALGRTSGAGGGDCAWALTDDRDTLDRAVAQAEALGFKRLDLDFPAPGLVME